MARFGGPQEGFRHRHQHITALQPTVIILGFGANESFAGVAGLPRFEQGLNALLDSLGPTKARLVILSPPPQENLGPPLPNPAEHNKDLRLYADALRKTADKRGCRFVDLYNLLANKKPPLTENGLHFTEYGYWESADVLARDLCGQPLPVEGHIYTDQHRFTFQLPLLPVPPRPGHSADFSQALTSGGLKPGNYTLNIDGNKVVTASADVWAKGVKLPPALQVAQIEELRQTIIKKNQTYFHRWRPQNETYLFLFRKSEQGQNAKEIPEFDPYVDKLEDKIAELRVPAVHRYELVRQQGGEK
jgi:hypothetical protein